MRPAAARILASVIFSLWLGLAPSTSQATSEARWTILTPEARFFTPDAPGAGIIYPDRHALIYYMADQDGWVATLKLSTPAIVTSLTSRLVRSNGLSATLVLDENQMISSYDTDTRHATISFVFAAEDVERFQSAIEWIVETDFGEVIFSLNGSHAALKKLLEDADAET